MFWAWLRVNLTRTARWLWEGHKTYLCPWTQTILLFGEQKSPFLPVKCATMRDKVIRMVSCARNGQNDLRTQGTMGKTTPLSASGPFQSRANLRNVLGANHSWKHQSYFFIEANATRKENKSVYVKNNYYSLFFIQILFEYGKMLWMT